METYTGSIWRFLYATMYTRKETVEVWNSHLIDVKRVLKGALEHRLNVVGVLTLRPVEDEDVI